MVACGYTRFYIRAIISFLILQSSVTIGLKCTRSTVICLQRVFLVVSAARYILVSFEYFAKLCRSAT